MSMVPDISDRVSEYEVPMCPLCDDYLDDVTMTVRAHGATFTVHKDCYDSGKAMTEMIRERREGLQSKLSGLRNDDPCEIYRSASSNFTVGELRALLRDSEWRERVERQLGDVARYLEGHADFAKTETGREVMAEAARRMRTIVDMGNA